MATATGLNIQTCRRCPAKIVFLKTKIGSQMPCDAETVQPGDQEYDHARHMSHFATCPAAAKFRKSKPEALPKKPRAAKPEALPKPELVMQMTFYNEPVTERFVALCKKHGLHGGVGTKSQGTRIRYRVTVKGFKNRTAMANFTATWAAMSVTRE